MGERERFEKWVKQQGWFIPSDLHLHPLCDEYRTKRMQYLWISWQAGVAAQQAEINRLKCALRNLLNRIEHDKDAQNWWPDARAMAHKALALAATATEANKEGDGNE
jgi:hypothetical protein